MPQDLSQDKVVKFFSETVHTILKFETSETWGRPEDISLNEMHVIEAVARAAKDNMPARATEIAAYLHITPGTFTYAADVLEKKGYITRSRDLRDLRSVRVTLTDKGVRAREKHRDFHVDAVRELLGGLSDGDAQTLTGAAEILQAFYAKKEAAFSKGMRRNNKVKIYADSTCDIAPEAAEKLDIRLIPMSINIDDMTYRQNVDLSAADFYKKLSESKTPPTTFQLTPYDLEQIYKDATADGSEVVTIHLSSAISGTYQSATLAAREVSGVYPVDSQNVTAGMALLTLTAAALRDEGESAKSIAEKLKELSDRVFLLAYMPTLKYLVRGGRISSSAGLVGSALNVYPIISIKDGIIKNIGKARGKNRTHQEMLRILDSHGIDKRYGVVFAHATAAENLEAFKSHLKGRIEGCASMDCEIGAVIGAHSGPGAVGIAFIAKTA